MTITQEMSHLTDQFFKISLKLKGINEHKYRAYIIEELIEKEVRTKSKLYDYLAAKLEGIDSINDVTIESVYNSLLENSKNLNDENKDFLLTKFMYDNSKLTIKRFENELAQLQSLIYHKEEKYYIKKLEEQYKLITSKGEYPKDNQLFSSLEEKYRLIKRDQLIRRAILAAKELLIGIERSQLYLNIIEKEEWIDRINFSSNRVKFKLKEAHEIEQLFRILKYELIILKETLTDIEIDFNHDDLQFSEQFFSNLMSDWSEGTDLSKVTYFIASQMDYVEEIITQLKDLHLRNNQDLIKLNAQPQLSNQKAHYHEYFNPSSSKTPIN